MILCNNSRITRQSHIIGTSLQEGGPTARESLEDVKYSICFLDRRFRLTELGEELSIKI